MKFEKNKKLKKKIMQLQQQIQKKYEISEESMVNSNYYISDIQDEVKDNEYDESFENENGDI